MSFVRFGTSQDFEAICDGLMAAFASFGGVPQEVLFDNMKAIVLEWLAEVANVRLHAGLKRRPKDLWQEELAKLTPLPHAVRGDGSLLMGRYPTPVESIQHPLSVYGELLEAVA